MCIIQCQIVLEGNMGRMERKGLGEVIGKDEGKDPVCIFKFDGSHSLCFSRYNFRQRSNSITPTCLFGPSLPELSTEATCAKTAAAAVAALVTSKRKDGATQYRNQNRK